MKHKTTRTLYAYWNAVRGNRMAPSRYEIEPAGIGSVLSETLILERPDVQDCRFRLAGTQVCDYFAHELRGADFYGLWSHNDAILLRGAIETAAEHGAVGHFTFEARIGTSQKHAEFELLLLPLIHTGPSADRFLGSIAGLEVPYWIGTSPPDSLRVTSHELVWPEGRPRSKVNTSQTSSKTTPPLASNLRSARIVRSQRRSFLVYEGGRSPIFRGPNS